MGFLRNYAEILSPYSQYKNIQDSGVQSEAPFRARLKSGLMSQSSLKVYQAVVIYVKYKLVYMRCLH